MSNGLFIAKNSINHSRIGQPSFGMQLPRTYAVTRQKVVFVCPERKAAIFSPLNHAVNSQRGCFEVSSPGIYPAPIGKPALEVLEGLRMDMRALVLVH